MMMVTLSDSLSLIDHSLLFLSHDPLIAMNIQSVVVLLIFNGVDVLLFDVGSWNYAL